MVKVYIHCSKIDNTCVCTYYSLNLVNTQCCNGLIVPLFIFRRSQFIQVKIIRICLLAKEQPACEQQQYTNVK